MSDMKEIRLGWSITGRTNRLGEPIQSGTWQPDNPAMRRELEIIRDAGNEQYGPCTHWIEFRES